MDESRGGEGVELVGVVGSGADTVADRFRDADISTVANDDPAPVLDASPDVVVTVGESALLSCARRAPAVPLLAVDAPRGTLAVPRADLGDAVDRLLDGEWSIRERPLLSVDAGEHAARALLDVSLLAPPLGMSEYAVETVDAAGDPLPVDQFRADGVVVATPAGSQEYAHDTAGPGVSPGVDAASVVPIAPFTIDRDHWVVEFPVTLTVVRDECEVTLYADDRRVGGVEPGDPVAVTVGGSVGLVALPGRRSYFRGAKRLEKT